MSPSHSKSIRLIVAALIAALAGGGGYWAGRQSPAADTAASVTTKGERKILFYRNPMGLPDTSPVPKKDPMGMDYLPVFEGEADAANDPPGASTALRISTEKIQKLGVKTDAARLRVLEQTVRAAGRIEPDERRLSTIAPKFEGYVERLHVNVTGQAVRRGQPLFEVYSPELVSAQREYALAAQGVDALKAAGSEAQQGMRQLAEASLQRLRNWDISDAQIQALKGGSEARRSLTYSSPVNGIVIERKAIQGMRFMPGEALYQIADLSSVWVIADIAEQDIGLIRPGVRARVRLAAYPDKSFEGTLSTVYPTLNAGTRTVPVRIELPNPDGRLKPAMFAQVEIAVGGGKSVITVPNSTMINSSTRQIVFIEKQAGRFEPREVKLGARSDSAVEVREGVREGDIVVVAANFLIDAESNLKAAVAGFSPAGERPAPAAAGHHADGVVDEIDVSANALTITHAPVASLKWPAMTMEFKTANPVLLKGLKPGAAIAFDFVERGPGEWVITALRPGTPGKPNAHSAH